MGLKISEWTYSVEQYLHSVFYGLSNTLVLKNRIERQKRITDFDYTPKKKKK